MHSKNCLDAADVKYFWFSQIIKAQNVCRQKK